MFSKNLKKLRKILKYTIDEMALALNVNPRTYGSWEREGKIPSFELGTKLYKNLNVNINWFVSGEGSMFNKQNSDTEAHLREVFNKMLKERGL